MIVLGLNAFHGDASACLLRDGELVAAAEEERFRRIKHWAGFPTEAIRWCLRDAGVGLDAVSHVAVNQDSRANLGRKLAYVLRRRPELSLVLDRIRNRSKREGVDVMLSRALSQPFSGTLHFVEHHRAHLASAFLASPFEEAAAVSVDGFGDFASAAWGLGRGGKVAVDARIYFPHSLGLFYQALTQYLGFPNYGDEYKLMGLAPYGAARFLREMRQILHVDPTGGFELDLQYFRHASEKIDYQWESGEPAIGRLYTPALEALLGPARGAGDDIAERHCDLACSVQAMYEEALFALLNAVHRRYGVDNVALAGGCAMNSVANGKIYSTTPFRKLYVQAAAGDAGGAIGAALAVWGGLSGGQRGSSMDHAYWGPAPSEAEIEAAIETRRHDIDAQGCVLSIAGGEPDLCAQAAQAVADGCVVGWFQGRMEWGPRALGNRSIVCDPRHADMKDLLNRKIKRRESFRPFAPSILREAVAEWFEVDDDVPFMTQVYPIRTEKRGLIPAVTHIDGSGRPQTVTQRSNPRYYRLIAAFRDLTGIPLVLNTSFNENEPIVCTPREALECFLRTEMDMLVIGSWVITRRR
jgi:carbamoyltransferase